MLEKYSVIAKVIVTTRNPVKTAAFVQGTQNVNVTTNSHDPNYDKFTHDGHVSNFDGSKFQSRCYEILAV